MGYGTFRCTVLAKTKVAYGWEWYIEKTLVGNRFAVYTFLTKEKRGSVSDNYDLGTIEYHTLAILS